ncbi:hypothetical protein ACWCL1_08205 [Ligilactobacillus sp. LYQ135]
MKNTLKKNTTSKDGIVYISFNDLHIHRVSLNDRNIKPPSKKEYAVILSKQLGRIVQVDNEGIKIDLNHKNYRKKTFLADGALFLGWALMAFYFIFFGYIGTTDPYGYVFVDNVADPFVCMGLVLVSGFLGNLLLVYSFGRNNFIKRYRLNKKFFN